MSAGQALDPWRDRPFVEVDHQQVRKHGQAACGDVVLSQKTDGDARVITVLADGLGSGIKASVLAHLTATMAARFMASDVDMTHAARTIMETLPVCRERGIAYSTFTIVDVDRRGEVRVLEFDNPPFILLRSGAPLEIPAEAIPVPSAAGPSATLRHSRFTALPGDRIVVCSDGVTQSGVGQRGTPLGWGPKALREYLRTTLRGQPALSARQLARSVVQRALSHDGQQAKDDITCGVIYLRKPRKVLVLTGPPVDRARDAGLADLARGFEGQKVICGGTTARLISRELDLPVRMELKDLDPHVPPTSSMEGFALVTEGALTLAALVRLLEAEDNPELLKPNAATQLAGVLLDGDIIHIVAGTRINDALQDPSLPEDLDIRRNILRRLQRVLEEKFLKDVRLEYR